MPQKTKSDVSSVRLDAHSQTIVACGRHLALQYKAWCVLTRLIDAAPAVVTRANLIDDIWSGNYAVGDKALTHALWTIRAGLGDSVKQPAFIRTIPREGYQWVGPAPVMQNLPASFSSAPKNKLRMRGVAAALFIFAAPLLLLEDHTAPPVENSHDVVHDARIVTASTGSKAFFSGRDLVLENLDGCQFLFKARPESTFSTPIFSDDGAHMAFRVQQAAGCKLVIYEVGETGAPQIFDTCPTFELAKALMPSLT